MFLAPFFLGGGELPEFLESIYKIDAGSDHVAKFCGDRPRELGDYALKKKKTSRAFYKTSRCTGGLKMEHYVISLKLALTSSHDFIAALIRLQQVALYQINK